MAKLITKSELIIHNEWLQARVDALGKELTEARKINQQRIDTTMAAERREVLHSLGQMVDAVSHAIRFTVGKEVM